jgi:hypothetical protein
MLRVAIASAAVFTLISIGIFPVVAQTLSPTGKSPGEIAAASRLLAEKQENCRHQAKEQKLTYLKRRRFVRECMQRTP